MTGDISCVIVARDEEKYLELTLKALENQSVKPSILLVDDGSLNGTKEIAERYVDKIIDSPPHIGSYVGTPRLAHLWNHGLKYIRNNWKQKYVLTLGADHILPPRYIEEITGRMNGKTVLASGSIKGEKTSAPRGSSRITEYEFWSKTSQLQYPVNYGWESYTIFKALAKGYSVKCFSDITTEVQRPTGNNATIHLGKGMYALGYHWKYAVARSLLLSMRNLDASGLKMFYGWFTHTGVERMDVADHVNEMQKKMLVKKLKKIFHGDTLI
jgi:glycosyltransferase involved in cell wall biosynthesis